MFLLRIDGVTLLEHPLPSPSHSECYLQAAGRSWKCLSLSLCGPGVLSFTVTDEYLFFILGPVKKAREERGGWCCSVCHWSRGFPVDLRFLQAAWARARAWPHRRWGRGALPVLCCSLLVSTPTFSSSKFRRCDFVFSHQKKNDMNYNTQLFRSENVWHARCHEESDLFSDIAQKSKSKVLLHKGVLPNQVCRAITPGLAVHIPNAALTLDLVKQN